MPGVHSDVGGGYRSGPDVVHFPPRTFYWIDPATRDAEIAAQAAAYQTAHAAPGLVVEPIIGRTNLIKGGRRATSVRFQASRHVYEDLAYVALERMYAAAVDSGVPLQPLATLGREGYAYEVSETLRRLVRRAERAGPGSEAYNALYREYIHHSHQYHRPELVTGNGWREDLANVVNS
ncbi:hypothetical protein, partial [Alkalilimnicola ehrlichii]|uniref:hypothetical protein n=1 Tax=Alkalilimnicola ehrlichii TaxID=351052 RepID=UPI002162E643